MDGIWRRGRDSNSRSTKWTPVFKTGGFNRSPTPPDKISISQEGFTSIFVISNTFYCRLRGGCDAKGNQNIFFFADPVKGCGQTDYYTIGVKRLFFISCASYELFRVIRVILSRY